MQHISTLQVGEESKTVEFRDQWSPMTVYVRDPCHVFGQKYPVQS